MLHDDELNFERTIPTYKNYSYSARTPAKLHDAIVHMRLSSRWSATEIIRERERERARASEREYAAYTEVVKHKETKNERVIRTQASFPCHSACCLCSRAVYKQEGRLRAGY